MTADVVDLVLGGARFTVARDEALELFERNLQAWGSGRVEAAAVALRGESGGTLRLILGIQPLAVIEPVLPTDDDQPTTGRPGRDEPGSLEETFPDMSFER